MAVEKMFTEENNSYPTTPKPENSKIVFLTVYTFLKVGHFWCC